MSSRTRCRCQRCTIRGLMGPVIVVTIGVLFLLQQLRGGYFDFSNTYPVILIVIGAILLFSAVASEEGHPSSSNPPQPPNSSLPGAPLGPPAAQGTTPSSFSGQGQ
jgi:ABC-type Fe3+ transport system permease subunit